MSGHRYFIVDVFAREKYSGNQLAVVLPSRDLGSDEMQKIALEFHFSETAFILSPEIHNGGYDVRIFTPHEEVPFAGHPTLGTAWIIRNEIAGGKEDTIILNLKVGQIPVRFDPGSPGIIWMKQINPLFGETHNAQNVAGILGVGVNDMDSRFPVQKVSTGLSFLIIPLNDLSAVKKARTVKTMYDRYFEKRESLPLFIFSPETYDRENQLNARMFADELGVTEDPATGSAAGCLAGYLARYRYFGESKIDIRMEQGYEIQRESLLYLNAEDRGAEIDVHVGGSVFMSAGGTLL